MVLFGPVADCTGWHRAGDAVSLSDVAPHFQQNLKVGIGFYAFGDGIEFKCLSEGNDAQHDRVIAFPQYQVAHERLVDFERVYRQAAQIRQR